MPRSAHMPDLVALELVVDVARHGSIGAAARARGVSQQSASERLRAVEAQVGVTLLQRGARGSRLTDAGTVLVEWASRLLDAADEVEAAIETLRADRSRELNVVASMTVAEHLLPRWLVLLRKRQAQAGQALTTVSLSATNSRQVVAAVLDGTADLGFVESRIAPTELRTLDIGNDELMLVVAPGDALARRRRPLTPPEVANLALTSREPGSGTRQVVETALEDQGLTMAPPAVELTTSTAVRESVRAGSAPAFLSPRTIEHDLAAGQLVEVATSGLSLTRTFRAVWSGTKTPPAGPVRDLLSLATATMS